MTKASSADEMTKPYHRGDLRAALAAAARAILEAEGIESVTLRRVGTAVGVSRQAPYHHFADKGALLAAVAADGFEGLTRAMQAKMALETTPVGRLLACGVGYVAFALENPALFRLMFGGSGESFATDAELIRQRRCSHEVLTLALEAGGRIAPEALAPASLAAWSTVHGLAELINKGAVKAPPMEDAAAEPFIRAVLMRLNL